MPIVRIFQQPKNAMQSGKARTREWLLEFEPEPKHADPLTGWAGGGSTREQVRLSFPTSAAAVTYCEAQGFDYELVPAPEPRLKLQAYADNFR